jgi:hypothetical protein
MLPTEPLYERVLARSRALWNRLGCLGPQQAHPPAVLHMPPEEGASFAADAHYFQVRISELSLAYRQEWFRAYEPLLIASTEFVYQDQPTALPMVAGLSGVGARLHRTGEGLALRDLRLAGWHPYRGGPLAVSLVVCRVPRSALSRPLLWLLEGAANVLEGAAGLERSLCLAAVLLESLEAWALAGAIVPLFGARTVLAPDAAPGAPLLVPGAHALINLPAAEIDPAAWSVRHGRLFCGDGPPMRGADYLLWRLEQTAQRDDLDALPCATLYARARRAAACPDEQSWLRARTHLLAWHAHLEHSPDLTPGHAHALKDESWAALQQLRQRALTVAQACPAPASVSTNGQPAAGSPALQHTEGER